MATTTRKSFVRLLLTQLVVSMVLSGVSLPVAPIAEAAGGNFQLESAAPKYNKTWLASIKCRRASDGTIVSYGTEPFSLAAAVGNAIAAKGLPYNRPSINAVIVSTDNGGGGSFSWNVGTPHAPTLNAVCQILGDTGDSYTSFTILDSERSGNYPNGKGNHHTPENNQLYRFVGTYGPSQCQDGVDNDGDGLIDFGQDPGCTNATDDSENTVPPAPAPCTGFTLAGSEAGQSRTIPCDGYLTNYSKDDNLVTVVKRGTKTAIVAACDDDSLFDVTVNTPVCRWPTDNGGVVCDFDSNAVLASGDTSSHCPNLEFARVNVKQGDVVTFYRRYSWHNAEGTVTFHPGATAQPACTDPWADVVVTQHVGTGNIAANRTNAGTALGANTATVAGYERFYSLGFNGEIVLGFSNYIVNGAGADITIYEATFGASWPLETADVYASQDGVTWTLIGTADNKPFQSNYENISTLDLGSLPWAKFLKFVDTTTATGDNDGFDLNAVKATTASCTLPVSLSINKTGPAEVVRGTVATYQITVANTGNTTAQNVRVQDVIPMPAGTVFVPSQSDSRCVLSASTVTCSLGDMAAGATDTVQISFMPPANATCGPTIWFKNTASVLATNASALASNMATATLICGVPANVTISKTGPAQVTRGSTATYQLTVTNTTATAAQNIVVTDNIPTGVSGITYVPSQSDSRCVLSGGAVRCNLGTVAGNQTITLNLTFNIPAFVAGTTTGGQTQFYGPEEYNVTQAVNDVPGHTFIPEDYYSAGALHYDANTANASCRFLMGAGAVATNYTLGHYTSCGDNNIATWNGSDYNIQNACGRNDFINTLTCRSAVNTQPATCSTGNITNVATLTGNGITTRTSNSVPTTVNCPAAPDLTINKTGPAQITRGTVATYQLTVTNNGTVTAPNAVVTDTIPNGVSGITYVPSQSDSRCALQSGAVRCNLGAIAVGQTITLNIAFQIPAFVPGTTTTGGQTQFYGPEEYNVTQAVNDIPGHTFIPEDYYSAGALHYDATTANASCAFLMGQGAVATSYTLGHYTSCGDNNIATWNGSDYTIQNACGRNDFINTLTCRSAVQTNTNGVCSTGNISNTATLVATGMTSRSSNAVATTVNCEPSPTLTVDKTGPAQATRGSIALYQLTVNNTGTVPAPNTVVTDTILTGIAGITMVPGQSDSRCTFSNGKATCNLGTVAVGQSITLNIALQIPAFSAGGGQTQTFSPDYDIRDFVNAVPGHTEIQGHGSTSPSSLHYDAATANASCAFLMGPGAVATNYTLGHFVTCADNSLATWNGTDYVVQNSCANNNRIDSLTCRAAVQTTCTPSTINDVALVTATNMTVRRSNAIHTQVDCPASADLSIQKTGPAAVIRGNKAIYQITVSNSGPSNADNVVITDVIPAGLTFSPVDSDFSCSVQGANVVCNIGTVVPGQPRIVAIAFDVPMIQSCSASTNVQNRATVTSSTADPTTGNNQSTIVTTSVDCPVNPLVSIEKTGPSTIINGSTATYVIKVRNTGNGVAQNVVVTDNLPLFNDGASFVSALATQGNCLISGPGVVCSLGSLAANGEANIVLVMSVGNAATAQACTGTQSISNTASVSATNITTTVSSPVTSSVVCPNAQCKVRARVNFGFTKNTGNGNMGRNVYLGNGSTASDGQFFDLIVNGTNVVDSTQPTNVPGVGIKRNANNTFSLVFYGFQNATSTEQVYGSVEFENAVASSFANDTTWPLELQGNGQFGFPGNNPQGPTFHDDEVFYQNGNSLVPFAVAENVNADKFTLGYTSTLDPNCAPSDLSIQKSGPSTIIAGNKVIYQITVSNAGPGIAQDVIIRDTTPAGLTFSPVGSDISCAITVGTTIGCNLGQVLPGVPRVVNIAFDTPAPQQCSGTINVVNTATVVSTSQDPNQTNNTSSTVSTNVTCPQGNLSITKTPNQTQITRGDAVSYTITVTNNGQGTAQNVTVTDFLPFISNGTVSFVPASSDSRCQLQGSSVSCALGAINGGNSVSFQITLATSQTNTTCTGGSTNLFNTAQVTGTNSNTTQVTANAVTVSCPAQANLTIVKSATPSVVTRGGTLAYAITVTNTGNGAAQNVVITDQLPTLPNGTITVNSNFASQGSCSNNNGLITCNLGTLNAGQQATVNIYVTVGSVNDVCSQSTVLNNTASVAATGVNTVSSTQASATINCGGSPNLSITKTASTTTIVRGGQMYYTVSVTNSGNAPAQNVSVTDNLPNLTNGSLVVGTLIQTQGTSTVTGDLVQWNIGTLNANTTVTLTIPVTVGATTNTCSSTQSISNTATVTATGVNSQTTTPVTTSVSCPGAPNLNITKSASTNSVTRGGQITYTITVQNNGSAAATNVSVNDQIAALSNGAVTIGTPSTTQGSCAVALPSGGFSGVVSCDLGTLNAGNSATISFTLTMGSASTACSNSESFSNSASVTSTNATSKTSSTVSTSVNCPAQGDLSISKTVSPSSITRGGTVAYTITVTNNGQGTAQNVVVTDNVPSPSNGSTVVTSATASNGGTCTTNGTNVTCNLGSMNAGAQRTIVIYATVGLVSNTCSATEILHNTASVTATGLNAQTSNSASVSVACGGSPNLNISKTASTSSMTRGGTITYTITVQNSGSAAATNVNVNDVIGVITNGTVTIGTPSTTQGSCAVALPIGNSTSGTLSCDLGTINAGNSATITVTLTMGSVNDTCSTSTNFQNAATVTSTGTNSQTSTSTSTSVNCPNNGTPTLSITKTASASSVTRGDALVYTITVQNTGNAAATNVTVSDNLPNLANGTLTIGSITSSQGSCTTSGDTVSCNVGTVAANSTVTITIPVTVGLLTNFCSSSTTLSNVATLFASGMSSKTSQSATTTVSCPGSASLSIQKTASSTQVTRGGTLTYTIVVNNGGTAPAQNVVVTDNLPNLNNGALTVQTATSTVGTCSINGTSISCAVGTLNQNQQATITIVVTVGAVSNTCSSSTSISNTASLTATGMNSQTSNGVNTTVNCPDVGTGEVTISKTDNRTTVAQGEVLNYVLTLTNTSSQSQTVTVTDSFSTLTTYLSSSDNGSLNGNVVTWNNVVVPANGTKTISMNAQVNNSASNGVQIVNQAYTGNKTATDTTTIQGTTTNGLTLTITDTPDPVEPCEQIRYSILLQNNNSTSITTDLNFVFQSSDLDFSSATDGGFENGNGVRWTSLFIAANSSRTVQATANVDCDANDGDQLRATATATNATAEVTTRVDDNGNGNSDIQVDLSADESEVQPGDEVEYTIDLTNDGNSRRCGDLELTLDSNTSFLDATSNGDDTSSRRVVWDNVCVDDNDEESFRATVRVRSSAEDGDEIEAKAEWLNEDDDETVDVVDDNGSSSSSDNGDVSLTKSADRFEANPNDEVTYTITIRNDTDSNLTNVKVSDSFQSDLLQIIDPAGASVSSGRLEWTVNVNRGQVRTLVYRARISGFARPGDTVHNSVIAQGGNMDGSKSTSADVRILGRLPQTGAGDYTKDLEDTGRFLSPFRGGADGSGFGGLLAFILGSIGLAGAGLLGKRYFI